MLIKFLGYFQGIRSYGVMRYVLNRNEFLRHIRDVEAPEQRDLFIDIYCFIVFWIVIVFASETVVAEQSIVSQGQKWRAR